MEKKTMKLLSKKGLLSAIAISLVICSITATANAWIYTDNATITEVISYEDTAGFSIFLFTGGVNGSPSFYCFVPTSEKVLTATILSFVSSGVKVQVHCYDVEESKAGYPAHKLHRIVGRP